MAKLKLVGFFACAVIAEIVFAAQSRATTINAPDDAFSLSISVSGLVTTEGTALTVPFSVTNNNTANLLVLTFATVGPTFVSGESTDVFNPSPTITGPCFESTFVNGTCNGSLTYTTTNVLDFDGDSGVSTTSFTVSVGQDSAGTGTFQITIDDPTTPLPGALSLFATGLSVIGLLAWLRSRGTLSAPARRTISWKLTTIRSDFLPAAALICGLVLTIVWISFLAYQVGRLFEARL